MALQDPYQIETTGRRLTCTISQRDVSHLELADVIDDCMQQMRNNGVSVFIFDLREVEFLASACLGVLVQFLQDLESTRGKIALVGCQDNVKFIFKVTRLDQVFDLYDDMDEALDALR